MEKQKDKNVKPSSAREMVSSQMQDVLYLSGAVTSGSVVNKKVIIKEAVSVTAPLLLQDCEIIFAEDVEKKDWGCLHVQSSTLEIKGGSIHYEQETKNESAWFRLSKARIKIDGTKVSGAGSFIETDAFSGIQLENADISETVPGFIVQNDISQNEKLTLQIMNCTFTQNNAMEEVLPLLDISRINKLEIKDSTFQGLSVPLMRIGLYSTVREIEISGSAFNNCNTSDYLISVNGGYGTKLLLNGCTFSYCSALYFADDPIEIKNCIFTHCHAVKKDFSGGLFSEAQGGAIHFDCYDYGRIESCTFENCAASIERNDLLIKIPDLSGVKSAMKKSFTGEGGAVFIDINPYHSKSMQIVDCAFSACRAAEKGGAICVTQDGKTKKPVVTIDGCRFEDCEAKEGSAVYHLSMVTGDFKWQTKEKPFVSAVINKGVYKNCTSFPAQGDVFESTEEDLSEKRENMSKMLSTIFSVMDTVIKNENITPEKRERFNTKINELEDELMTLKESDADRYDEIMVKIESLETKAEIQDTYEEIKEDFKTLVEDIVSDFKQIFE